jgi:tetratricopeptide (TPR) repeat protein
VTAESPASTDERPLSSAGSNRFALAALAASVFAIGSFLIVEVYSIDVWWHIVIGTEILKDLSIPTVDRYAAAALGNPYHDSHWLFQAVLAAFHATGGFVGVQLLTLVLWGAALAGCYRATRNWVGILPAAVLLFAVGMTSVERFLPRPELVTFAMIPWFYHLLARGRYRSVRDLLLLGVLQAMWANSHGLFVIGPFIVGSYLLGAIAARLRGDSSDLLSAVRALLVVLGATLLTPFGFAAWSYALVLMTEAGSGGPEVMQKLGELSPTFGAAARSGQAFWFFLLLLIIAVVAFVRAAARVRISPRMLVVVGMCAAAMSGRRNIVLFALVAAPYIAETLRDFPQWGRVKGAPLALAATLVMAGWSWYPLSGSYYTYMEIPARARIGVTPSFFPHEVPRYLESIKFSGNVLNSNTLGGFFLYHGYPVQLPLTDGRWEAYDSAVLERVRAATFDPDGWRWAVDRFDLGGVLLAHTSPEATSLLPSLSTATDWKLVYYDRAASFWLPENGLDSPPQIRPDPASLPGILRIDDGLILDSFLAGVGATEARIANLERSLDFGARRQLVLDQLGPLQVEVGRFKDAENTYQALLDLNRKNPTAYNELAFLAYRRGDLERARALISAAVKLDPANPKYRENLGRVEKAINQSGGQTEGRR